MIEYKIRHLYDLKRQHYCNEQKCRPIQIEACKSFVNCAHANAVIQPSQTLFYSNYTQSYI